MPERMKLLTLAYHSVHSVSNSSLVPVKEIIDGCVVDLRKNAVLERQESAGRCDLLLQSGDVIEE